MRKYLKSNFRKLRSSPTNVTFKKRTQCISRKPDVTEELTNYFLHHFKSSKSVVQKPFEHPQLIVSITYSANMFFTTNWNLVFLL